MENIDYTYLCTILGNLTGIPTRHYYKDRLLFYHSIVNLPCDPVFLYEKEILKIDAEVGYFSAPYFYYYGIVQTKCDRIVIGPVGNGFAADRDIRELAFRCDLDGEGAEEFVTAMKSIVPMPLESVLQSLCAMNYMMNGNRLSLKDIAIFESEQARLKYLMESEQLKRLLPDGVASDDIRLQGDVHNTLALEETIMNFVRKGNTAALREWLAGAPAVRPGILADNALRQQKNLFIVTATLASRSAIRGGLGIDEALDLSDAYIQKCELLSDIGKISNLQYYMISDYTERVEKIRHGSHLSSLVAAVSNYIQNHISESISVEDLSKAVFLSRSRLSVRFKRESGKTLVCFIQEAKVQEAKRLLRYTDKPLTSVSEYLAFSTPSRFSGVFRKYTGCTPGEYREKHAK